MVTASTSAGVGWDRWWGRLRCLALVGLLWAGLHYLVLEGILGRGLERPVTLVAGHGSILATTTAIFILGLGALLAVRMPGRHRRERGLLVVALSLGLWATEGGTMTHWLTLLNSTVGPPVGRVYWPLVGEYVLLAVLMTGVAASGNVFGSGPAGAAGGTVRDRLRATFGFDLSATDRVQGLAALAGASVILALALLLLSGPSYGSTQRGQVYFAVVVGGVIGVYAAARLFRVRHPIFFWPAPIVVGFIGALVAAFRPALLIPPEYNQLNHIPAWGLARPLPVEMVGVGVAACLWALRATSAAHADQA